MMKWIDASIIPDIRRDFPDECYFLSDKDLDEVWRLWVGETNTTATVSVVHPFNMPYFDVVIRRYLTEVKGIYIRNRNELRAAKKKHKGHK